MEEISPRHTMSIRIQSNTDMHPSKTPSYTI